MADALLEGLPPNCEINEEGIEKTSNVDTIEETHDIQNGDKADQKKSEVTDDTTVSGHGAVVAAHYNTIEEKGLAERNQSRIVYLRNFNNWIKSMLIDEYLQKVRDGKQYGSPLKVLDMCCGKGGDLFKWRTGRITHLICADLAETSVKQCQKRYEDLEERVRQDRRPGQCFSAEFIAADCTKVRLRERYQDSSVSLDLVSCQFSFHYSFESLAQAECILQNAAECLQPGGYFIGTMPDANEIMARLEKSKGLFFGNEVYSITFESDKRPYPLFGGKYDFHLEGVVNCPEFLVHFPTLERLALKYGLQKVRKEKFEDFYKRKRNDGRHLLDRMKALETYPPFNSDSKLLGNEETDYKHAEEHMKTSKSKNVGTLSVTEWEAASLYLVFAFEKMNKTLGNDDKVVYTPFVPKSRYRERRSDDAEGEPSSKYRREDSSRT